MLRKVNNFTKRPDGKVHHSPLAKYISGELTCVICRTSIKSMNVWKVHVNSRQHKQNVEATKLLTNQLLNRCSNIELQGYDIELKKAKENPHKNKILPPEIKEFCGNKNKNMLLNQKHTIDLEINDAILPEQFFDDPIQDAKIRNVEYKDQKADEWEKFQREIKELSTVSNTIILEEQEEATVVRQIEEIDEQIRRWTKVIDLETQKEFFLRKPLLTTYYKRGREKNESLKNTNESSDESDSFEEFSDWRSKTFKKQNSIVE